MSDERDRLEERLDQAFASLRPRPGFESELLVRIKRRPEPEPLVRRWAWERWAGAAAVVLIGLLGFLAVRLGGAHPSGGAAQSSARYGAAAAPSTAAFGKLPRPSPAALDASVRSSNSLAAPRSGDGGAPALPLTGTVARYREPSQEDKDAFARSLGAAGQGGRYSGPGFALLFYPTDADLGLEAHYVLRPAGPDPSGPPPPEGAARSAADAFLAQRHLDPGSSDVRVTDEGPLALVRYLRQYGSPVTVYVRGDGGIFQVSGPLPVHLEQAVYRLAPADQLRAAAHASAGDRPQLVYVLAFDGEYGYFEPAAAFRGPGGALTAVPAVDSSWLR